MQVVILCGGQGSRIRDVAEDIPKPMIPVGGRPLLWHIMKGFARHGFTDFILCLGYHSWVIKRFFLDFHLAGADFSIDLCSPSQVQIHRPAASEPWRVTLVETGLEVMTGCRVKRIEPYIDGEHFLLTYGDGVADVDLSRLVAFHRMHGRIATVTTVRPPGRFGEIELEANQVIDFNEKPATSRGWINGGFFVFNRRVFERLNDDAALALEAAPLRQLARDGELMAYCHDGFWQPMDTSRDHQYLSELWVDGRAPWKTWDQPRPRAAA